MPQDQKQPRGKREEESAELPAAKAKDETLAADVNDVLDDIDAVLGDLSDEEAQAWVDSFVQQGGE